MIISPSIKSIEKENILEAQSIYEIIKPISFRTIKIVIGLFMRKSYKIKITEDNPRSMNRVGKRSERVKEAQFVCMIARARNIRNTERSFHHKV